MGAYMFAWVDVPGEHGAELVGEIEFNRDSVFFSILGYRPMQFGNEYTVEVRGFPHDARHWLLQQEVSDLDDPDDWYVRNWLTIAEVERVCETLPKHGAMNEALRLMQELQAQGRTPRFVYGIA